MRYRGHTAALLLLVLAVGACAAPATPSTQPEGEGRPKQGGLLRVRSTTDLTDFDISTGPKTNARTIASYVYNRLLTNSAGPDVKYEDFTLQPELAVNWEVSPDARAFTFHLQKGVKFQNLPPVNGRELTSEDVKWSYEYWSRGSEFQGRKLPASQYVWLFEGLDRIETPDRYTVVVRFKEPFAPFLSYAGSQYNPVVPREVFEQDGNFKSQAVGTGPFQLDQAASQAGSRWVFKRNPGYWKEGKPYAEELRELIIASDSSAEAAFKTKQLEYLEGPGCEGARGIRDANPDAQSFEGVSPSPTNLYINTRVSPLNDVRIRNAFALSMNRDEIIKTLQCGKGEWALSGALPDTFTQEERRQILRHDPQEARRLVSQAGYPNGVDIEWMYTKDYGDLYESVATLIQSQAKQAGVNVVFKLTTRAEVQTARRTADKHMITATGKTLEPDAESYLYQVFHPTSTNNYGGTNDPKLTGLIDAQRREADPVKRKALIREAVRYINGEMAYGLAITYDMDYKFWQPYVKGLYPNFWVGQNGFAPDSIWLDK